MALTACKDCSKEFSTDAKVCPHCGAKPPKPKTNPLWYLAVFIIMGTVPLLSGIDDGSGPSLAQINNQRRLEVLARATEGAMAIKNSMRNPDSFAVSAIVHNPQSDFICYEFRAQNGFGGMNTEHTIIKNNREFIYEAVPGFKEIWNRECGSAGTEVVSPDVVNATLRN